MKWNRNETPDLCIFTAETGKGKTTTGMGLCIRAAGYGMKVLVYQFMKDNSTSERKILCPFGSNHPCFRDSPRKNSAFRCLLRKKRSEKPIMRNSFPGLVSMAAEENYGLVFFDEIIYTIQAGLLDEQLVLDFLRNKPRGPGGNSYRPGPQPRADRGCRLRVGKSGKSNILSIRESRPEPASNDKTIESTFREASIVMTKKLPGRILLFCREVFFILKVQRAPPRYRSFPPKM